MLPVALGPLAKAGAALRGRVADSLPAGSPRRSFWTRFFFGEVRDAFIAGDSCSYLAGVDGLFLDEAQAPVGRVSFLTIASDDPELLTLKAQRKLQEADVIVHDRSIAPAILETARRDATRIATDGKLFDETDGILIREARAGRRVVRLSWGATLLEETVAVAADGVAFDTVPDLASSRLADSTAVFPVRDDYSEFLLKAAS